MVLTSSTWREPRAVRNGSQVTVVMPASWGWHGFDNHTTIGGLPPPPVARERITRVAFGSTLPRNRGKRLWVRLWIYQGWAFAPEVRFRVLKKILCEPLVFASPLGEIIHLCQGAKHLPIRSNLPRRQGRRWWQQVYLRKVLA